MKKEQGQNDRKQDKLCRPEIYPPQQPQCSVITNKLEGL